MAHIYKVSALIPSDGMLHMQQLLHRAGARRLLQEAVIFHASTHPPLSTGAISALTILAAPAPRAPPLISGQSQSSNPASTSFDTVTHFSPSVAIIMVALLSAFFFLGFFSLYVRRCADTSSSDARRPLRRANDLQDQQHQGVDMEFLHSLPLIAYSSAKKKGTNVECVVCLTEFEEHEPLRQLPGCKHVFHQDCIDMWLFSHSTCPLCRRNVTRSSGSFSLRWGGSGNFRQLSFLGGGGGSGQQLALLGGGGGSGQQLNGMDDTVMVVRMERESSNAIAGIQSTSPGQGHGSPSTDLNLTNPLQSAEMIVDSSHGNLGSESAVSSIMAAREGSSDQASNRSRRLQVACSLARSNSTGHSLQLLMVPGPANEAASLWTDAGDSFLPRTSLHRWHSEMAEQHGNHAL